MKIHLKNNAMRLIISLLTVVIFSFSSLCMTVRAADDEVDVLDLRLDENIATPEVPKKAKQYVHTVMDNLRRHLNKNGMNAVSSRDGEVLEITIPASELFAPGSLELKASAKNKLQPLGVVLREPQKFKVLLAVHTDDTGDSQYADSISAERANAIDDCFWEMAGQKDTNVIPYGIGKDEPVDANTSRNGRAKNRRVEIFIVPDKGLLELAGVKFKN